jgi:hypothetical protein
VKAIEHTKRKNYRPGFAESFGSSFNNCDVEAYEEGPGIGGEIMRAVVLERNVGYLSITLSLVTVNARVNCWGMQSAAYWGKKLGKFKGSDVRRRRLMTYTTRGRMQSL